MDQPLHIQITMITHRKKILITYEYFLPAYKAGGPVQSIANLCRQLSDDYDFYIICSDKDHKEANSLAGIKKNEWNSFEENTAQVFYLAPPMRNASSIKKLLREVEPDIVLVNGLFSPLFSLAPLFYARCKKILSVRGMLHAGALSQKKNKKRIFIFLLKLLRVSSNVVFHATDKKEEEFIHATFGKKAKVVVAQNFSNPILEVDIREKKDDCLKLVSVGLISPMKNHLLVLEALRSIEQKVLYRIYGPVKDESYWMKCREVIAELPPNITVRYEGPVEPSLVRKVLAENHVFILPSKSENFGHAHFEALSSGLPLITSYFTPWNQLSENYAGWNVDIENLSTISRAIRQAALFDEATYQQWSQSASEYARQLSDMNKVRLQYRELFEN
jgi:glycosyltransferase involved in cell wall biosynthesis